MTLFLFIWPLSGPITPDNKSGCYLKVLKMSCCCCWCCYGSGETVSYNFWLILSSRCSIIYPLRCNNKTQRQKRKNKFSIRSTPMVISILWILFFSSEWCLLFFSLYFYIVLLTWKAQLILVLVHQESHFIYRPLRCLAVKITGLQKLYKLMQNIGRIRLALFSKLTDTRNRGRCMSTWT